MKKQLSKEVVTLMLIFIAMSFSYLLKAQSDCPYGYEERDVKCNGMIVKKCVPVDYTCKDCWALEWQGCNGKWTYGGLEFHSTYQKCSEAAEKTERGKEVGECPTVWNKHVYRIYIDNKEFCNSDPCSGTVNLNIKEDLKKRADILISRFKGEYEAEKKRLEGENEYFAGNVKEEYEANIEQSEKLVQKFGSEFIDVTNKCLDKLQSSFDQIQNEEQRFLSYSSSFKSQNQQQRQAEQRKKEQDDQRVKNEAIAKDNERKRQDAINSENNRQRIQKEKDNQFIEHQSREAQKTNNAVEAFGRAGGDLLENMNEKNKREHEENKRKETARFKSEHTNTITCSACGGSGRKECTYCDGGYKTCIVCNGSLKQPCPICFGRGVAYGIKCVTCSGSGYRQCSNCFGKGRTRCFKCSGRGYNDCRECHGKGVIVVKEEETNYTTNYNDNNSQNDYSENSAIENNSNAGNNITSESIPMIPDAGNKIYSFEEYFNNNENNWPVFSKTGFKATVENGKGIISVDKNPAVGVIYFLKSFPINVDNNFSVEVTCRNLSGRFGYGFAFCSATEEKFNEFLIQDNSYKITNYSSEAIYTNSKDIVPWTEDNIIRTGNLANHLRIVKNGKNIFFYINSKLVKVLDFLESYGSQFGLVVLNIDSPVETVEIDDFKIVEYSNSNDRVSATEEYSRCQKDIRASHILVNLAKDASPSDTLIAYKKALQLRNEILEGKDFSKVAFESSDDSSTKKIGGDLGFFTCMQMVYPFETTSYSIKIGEISMPVRTRFGYHLIKVTDVRTAIGLIHVAQIMILLPNSSNDSIKKNAKSKIYAIYNKIKKGEKFDDLVLQYSEDKGSVSNGGILPWFGAGRMVPEFENAAFSLKNDGDVSLPIQTSFGWHIIKRLEAKPILPYEEIKTKVEEYLRK